MTALDDMTATLDDITVFVPGHPAPQGSKRHLGGGVMIESSKRVKPWRTDIREALDNPDRAPITGAVAVDLMFVMPRPRSHYRTGRNAHLLRDAAPRVPTSKPDIDKLARAVLDAIGSAGVWSDDAQVVELLARKRYATLHEPSGARITIKAAASSETCPKCGERHQLPTWGAHECGPDCAECAARLCGC